MIQMQDGKSSTRQTFTEHIWVCLFVIGCFLWSGCYSAGDPHPEIIPMDSLNLIDGELKMTTFASCPGEMEIISLPLDEKGNSKHYSINSIYEAIPYEDEWLYYRNRDTVFYDCMARRYSFSPAELLGEEGGYEACDLLIPTLSGELLFQGTVFTVPPRIGYFLLDLKKQKASAHYKSLAFDRQLPSILHGIQQEIEEGIVFQPDSLQQVTLNLLGRLFSGAREHLKELSLRHREWYEEGQKIFYNNNEIMKELLQELLSAYPEAKRYQAIIDNHTLFFPHQQVAVCTEYARWNKLVENIPLINIPQRYGGISYKDCHVKAKSAGAELVVTDDAQLEWSLPHLFKGSGGKSFCMYYYRLTVGEKVYQFKWNVRVELLESVEVEGQTRIAMVTPVWSHCPGQVYFLTCYPDSRPAVFNSKTIKNNGYANTSNE